MNLPAKGSKRAAFLLLKQQPSRCFMLHVTLDTLSNSYSSANPSPSQPSPPEAEEERNTAEAGKQEAARTATEAEEEHKDQEDKLAAQTGLDKHESSAKRNDRMFGSSKVFGRAHIQPGAQVLVQAQVWPHAWA